VALAVAALVLGSACAGSAEQSKAGGADGEPEFVAGAPSRVGPRAPSSPGAADPGRRPEHPVFSLADNRLLAHHQRDGGLLVLAGSAALAKYTRFGKPKPMWRLRQNVAGTKVAQPLASPAELDLPLTARQTRAHSVRMALHAVASTRLQLDINGRSAGSATVKPGWHEVSFAVPGGALVAGENRFALRFRGRPAALHWLQVGGEVSAAAQPRFRDGAFVLGDGDGLAFYVKVPKGARLVGRVTGAATCRLEVTATAHDGQTKGVLSAVDTRAVNLAPLAGAVARLDLIARGCPTLQLRDAALTTPGAAPRVERGRAPKNVVFWIMDTLRADRVRIFHPGARPEVPNWERLAARSAVFRNAFVQGNESQASHASMWTSVYPVNHDINISRPDGPWQLHQHLPMLGRLMKKAGLYTTGVTANGFVTRPARYGSGFVAFSNPMRDGHGKRLNGKIPADMIWERVLASLRKRHNQPFFAFIGTIDTHKPWVAREPWITQYDPEPYRGRYQSIVWGGDVGVEKGRMISRKPQSPRDLKRLKAMYDCGVSYQDEYLGRLLDTLDKWGVAEDTMIVITADHGEELWEEGRVGHGASLRQSLVHVPLLISYPPLLSPGVVVEGVETVDILPTVLDALGERIPDGVQGESLIPLAQGAGRGYPRPAIASQYEYHHAMSLGGWKIVARRSGGDNERVQVYDLESDYDERHNLAATRPVERRFLTDVLGLYLSVHRDWRKRRWGVASNMTARAAADLDGD
jgi:arylsulfatase A-like enzyme